MQLVSIKTIADLLSVKRSTIYSWVHNGTIPFRKLNGLIRFDLDEIEAWIEAAKHQASPSFHRSDPNSRDINSIVKKAIEGIKGRGYNCIQRETRPNARSQEGGLMGLFKRGQVWWMRFTFKGKQVRKPTETTDKKLAEKIYHKVMTQIAKCLVRAS